MNISPLHTQFMDTIYVLGWIGTGIIMATQNNDNAKSTR